MENTSIAVPPQIKESPSCISMADVDTSLPGHPKKEAENEVLDMEATEINSSQEAVTEPNPEDTEMAVVEEVPQSGGEAPKDPEASDAPSSDKVFWSGSDQESIDTANVVPPASREFNPIKAPSCLVALFSNTKLCEKWLGTLHFSSSSLDDGNWKSYVDTLEKIAFRNSVFTDCLLASLLVRFFFMNFIFKKKVVYWRSEKQFIFYDVDGNVVPVFTFWSGLS